VIWFYMVTQKPWKHLEKAMVPDIVSNSKSSLPLGGVVAWLSVRLDSQCAKRYSSLWIHDVLPLLQGCSTLQ
jgi:hypothetical protein